MNHRTVPLSAVESHMKQKCKFINLRDAITFFPDDKKVLGLANRFHNYQAIRNDLRKAHNLLGEVIRFQNQERLLASPHLFSAGWFYAVILYTRIPGGSSQQRRDLGWTRASLTDKPNLSRSTSIL